MVNKKELSKKTGTLFLLVLLLALPISSLVPAIEAQEEEWTVIERGENFVRGQNIANPNLFNWESAPMWILDETSGEYVPYIYSRDEGKKCYVIQSALIAAEIYDTGITKFFDPDLIEERVKSETWQLWVDDGGNWKEASLSSIVSFNVTQTSTSVIIEATRSTSKPAGQLLVQYLFREGSALKHTVLWTSESVDNETVQIRQLWDLKLSTSKVVLDNENLVTTSTNTNSTSYLFKDELNNFLVLESQWSAVYFNNGTLRENGRFTEADIDFAGKKVVYTFTNWTLGNGETLEIDPTTSTFYISSSDGYIWQRDAVYLTVRNIGTGNADSDTDLLVTGQLWHADYFEISRSMIYVDTSTIPENFVISSAILMLYGANDWSGVDFDLVLYEGTESTYPHDPPLSADYALTKIDTATSFGTYNTVDWTTVAYNNITLTEAGRDGINTEGTTKLYIISSRDENADEPTEGNTERVTWWTNEKGGVYVPKLVVTYTSEAMVWLPFDDQAGTDTLTSDYSGNDNDGVITGASRTYEGHFGMALDFDGTDYVTVIDDSSIDFEETVYLAAWIYPTTIAESVIIDKPSSYGFYMTSSGGLSMTINGEFFNTTSVTLVINNWYYVVAEYTNLDIIIYVNSVQEYIYKLYHEAIIPSAHDMIIGDEFIGRIDEVVVTDQVFATIEDPIADYPYVFNGYLDTTACSWIVSSLSYNFTGVYIQQDSTLPLTYANFSFTDEVSTLGLGYTVSTEVWDESKGDGDDKISFILHTATLTGNGLTIYTKFQIEDVIYSTSDVDLTLYCETALLSDTYIIEDMFSIYGLGGLTTTTTVGDGALIAGGSIFDVTAENSSLTGSGSSIRVDTVAPNFQHLHILTHVYQSNAWDVENWVFPTDYDNVGYLEYGVDLMEENCTWITGWKVRITPIDGSAGTFGEGTDAAWVRLNCTWYYNNTIIKWDDVYAAYEAYSEDDTTTQFSLYVDLWISSDEYSSRVGGHVSSQYYGMEETGWWLWATWGPKGSLATSSSFGYNLLDADGDVISASNLKMFKVWTKIAKTSEVETSDSDQWASLNEIAQIKKLPFDFDLEGIINPIFMPTTSPDQPVGLFASLGNILSGAIDRLYWAIVGTGQALTAAVIDGIFSLFGIENFSSTTTAYITSLATYFANSLSIIVDIVVSLFLIISSAGMFIITWFGRVVNMIVDLGAIMVSIIDGTSDYATGFGDILSMFDNLGTEFWTNFIPLVMIVGWFYSIDNRARKFGGGWVGIFLGDVNNIISVLSFMMDLAWRVVNTIIDLSMRFINLFT